MFTLLCACIPFFSNEPPLPDAAFKAQLDKTSKQAVEKIESTYKVKCCGFGGGTMLGIQSCMLAFTLSRPITIEQARPMIIGATEIYRDAINANKAIRPYLEEYPFPVSCVEMKFFASDDKSPKDSNYLSSFSQYSLKDNQVFIFYYVTNKFDAVLKEPYQQAQERLNEKNQ